MKRGGWLIFLSIVSSLVSAQARWDGEQGDGLWGSALNWVSDLVPGPGDNVLLDNSIVPGNYTVSFNPGLFSVTVGSLAISPNPSSLITLEVPVGNISPAAFVATGPGDAVILNAGAVFRNASGAPNGTPVSVTATNFFRINNGGRYIHNTERAHTNELVTRLSTAPGTEDGIFEFDVPSLGAYTVSGSGRTYGHLIFSATAAGGIKTYATSGTNAITVNGDLEIRTGTTFSYGANTNSIRLNKDCHIHPAAVFNISNGGNNSTVLLKGNLDNEGLLTESGTSTGSGIMLGGTSMQQVNSPGVVSQSVMFVIDNVAGIMLLSPLTLPYNLVLVNGKIHSTYSNILHLSDNSVCTGGSVASFVEGPLKKSGDDDFTFPTGVGGIYAPIAIRGGTGTQPTDEFIAEYVRANPQSLHGPAIDPFFNHISFVEYWRLNRTQGNASKSIGFTANQYSFVKDFPGIYATLYDGSQWINLGRTAAVTGPSFPPFQTGSFESVVTGSFGDFTLATPGDLALNPLPVQLLDFKAERLPGRITRLSWKIGGLSSPPRMIEIQRADTSGAFAVIATMQTAQFTMNEYDDRENSMGIQYYRLRLTDTNDLVSYSDVRSVREGRLESIRLIAIVPSRLGGPAITIRSSYAFVPTICVYDMMGRRVWIEKIAVLEGEHQYRLSFGRFARGMYLISGNSGNERTNVLRFVSD
jgi:hypothetical protein